VAVALAVAACRRRRRRRSSGGPEVGDAAVSPLRHDAASFDKRDMQQVTDAPRLPRRFTLQIVCCFEKKG